MGILADKVARKVSELGVPQAAEYFEVSETLVKQWEAGSKCPSLAAAEKVFADEAGPSSETWNTLPEASWEGKNVCLLLPWYKTTHPATALSLMAMLDRSKMGIIMAFGDAFISHSRNRLAADFLKTNCEWSFWADDDMVFPMGNAEWFNKVTGLNLSEKFAGMHTLNRLLSHQKKLVGGLYFGRHPQGKPMFAEGASSNMTAAEIRAIAPTDKILPTKWVATGCMLVHRTVYADISKQFPSIDGAWFSPSEHNLLENANAVVRIFKDQSLGPQEKLSLATKELQDGLEKAKGWSKLGTGEDVIFCLRAFQAGHQPYVDLGAVCGHVGHAVYGPKNTSA